MRTDDSDIDYLKNQSVISSDEEKEGEANENFGDKWQEMGPYLLLLLVPLAAYGFRRGLLGIFALFLLLPAYTPTASANWWDDMWQTKNQQGQQAFQAENYNAAAEHFEDPMWRGAAAYKAQDYDAALAAFQQAKGAQARYNEGNTLAQLGKLDEAIEAYDKALEIDPAHEDAKANKALLEQQKEQQDQQQQDNSDQQQGDDSQQNDNSQQSDNSEQGDNNQQGEQQNEQSSDQQQSQGSEQSQDGNSSDQSDANPSQPEDQPEQDNQGEQEGENEGDEPSAEQQNKDASAQQEEQDSSANNQSSHAMNDDQQLNEQDAQEQQASAAGVQSPEELTDEQKEQMQRMQTLLNRVPDDPAFLLKRKMQIENQKRRQQRTPTQRQRNW